MDPKSKGKGKGKGKALAIALAAKAKGKGKGKKGSGTPELPIAVEATPKENTVVGSKRKPNVENETPEEKPKPPKRVRKCDNPRFQKKPSEGPMLTPPPDEEGEAVPEVDMADEVEEEVKENEKNTKANKVLSFKHFQTKGKFPSSLKGVESLSVLIDFHLF